MNQKLADSLTAAFAPLFVEQSTAMKQLRDWTTSRLGAIEQQHDIKVAGLRAQIAALEGRLAEAEKRGAGDEYLRTFSTLRAAR